MHLTPDKQIFKATAATVTEDGVTLILPGQTQATRKAYKRLAGSTVTAGSAVLCARDSGTIIVMGNIV